MRAEGGRTQKSAQAGGGKQRGAAANSDIGQRNLRIGGPQDWVLKADSRIPPIHSTGTEIVAPRPRSHAQQVTRPDPPALLAGCCSILAF